MTPQRDDDRLREAFQSLRGETELPGRIPAFDAMLEQANRQGEGEPRLEVLAGGAGSPAGRAPAWRFARTGAWATAAVAASVAGLMLINRAPAGDDDFERLVAAYASESRGGSWSSPTSGLLEVPGIDLLRSMPSIGGPVRGLDPLDLPARQASPEEDPV